MPCLRGEKIVERYWAKLPWRARDPGLKTGAERGQTVKTQSKVSHETGALTLLTQGTENVCSWAGNSRHWFFPLVAPQAAPPVDASN